MLFNASFLATLLIIATPLLSAASPISNARNGGYDLRARDFNCDVKNVSCCKQTVTKEAAQKEFGNLLSLGDVVGNVGLSCTVSTRSLIEDPVAGY